MQVRKVILLTGIFVFLCHFVYSQNEINGRVLDVNSESLAFVNIIINGDDSKGVIADLDGRFFISSDDSIKFLTFLYVGYEKLVYELSDADFKKEELIIQMKSSSVGLNEVVVNAGENPAHRIIKKVVRNKKKNNHEQLSSYRCEIYSKMQMGYIVDDSLGYYIAEKEFYEKNKQRVLEGKEVVESEFSPFDVFLFMSEVVTDRKFKYPETVKNTLLHNRVAGLKTFDLSAINAFQQFTFYDDFILFGNESFVNPVSKGSTQLYFFNIEDTLYQQTDSIFIISYKPRKGKTFEGLEGLLYVNTNGYAVQNVVASPADADKLSWKIEHKYVFHNHEQWFPEQLNFELTMPDSRMDFASLKMSQRSYVSKVELNPKLGFKEMRDDFIPLKGDVVSKEDDVWNEHRKEKLSEKEQLSYVLVDSIGEKMKLDAILRVTTSLGTGNLSVKWMDIKTQEILKINNYESVRLGVGLQTNRNLSRYFSVGGYWGYGFKDKAMKYGGNMVVDIIPDDILEIKYEYSNDIREPGLFSFPLQGDLFLNRELYAQIMDKEERHALTLQGQYQFLRGAVTFEQTTIQPQYPYVYSGSNSDLESDLNFSELSLNLRYAFGENNDWFMGVRVPSPTRFPILYFSYTRGFRGVLKGDYDYHRIQAAIEQQFDTRFIGTTKYRIEAGMVTNELPYSRLFVSSGTGGSFAFIGLDNAFQTMDNYEFVSDRFVHFFFEHDIGNILYRKKYSKPHLILIHNMGFGTLGYEDNHSLVNVQSMEKGFFESGGGLDNIIIFPLRRSLNIGLGAKVYYRYGPYQQERTSDNLAFRFNLNVVF